MCDRAHNQETGYGSGPKRFDALKRKTVTHYSGSKIGMFPPVYIRFPETMLSFSENAHTLTMFSQKCSHFRENAHRGRDKCSPSGQSTGTTNVDRQGT